MEGRICLEYSSQQSPPNNELGTKVVSLRGRPSELGLAPMVSPTLCPNLSTALRSKFFPPLMVNAAGIGQMMINCALWKRALSAAARWQPQHGGMAFADHC